MAFPWWVLPHHASWYTSITVPRDPIVSIKWPITWATNPSHFAHVALRPIRSSFFSRTSTSSKDSSQVQRSVRRELGSQLVAARRSFKISNISHCVDGFKISNHFFGCSFRVFFQLCFNVRCLSPTWRCLVWTTNYSTLKDFPDPSRPPAEFLRKYGIYGTQNLMVHHNTLHQNGD